MQKKKDVAPTFAELQQKQIQENLQAQKDAGELIFKQDCRRTAVQMAERFSKANGGDKEHDPVKIISNAEVIYQWMINITNDELSDQLLLLQYPQSELSFKKP